MDKYIYVFSAGKAAFRKRGRYGSHQSGKSNAVGAEDEQHPQCCYRNRCKRFDLRITNIYRKAAVNRQWLLLSGSNQEVIKFCVQSKKLKRFYVEFILFFKKILDFLEGYAILYYDTVYSAGKEI